jgi:hypothetical protein
MQERFVLLEGVLAGALGGAQGCLQSGVCAWRPAPSVRGTAQRGVGTGLSAGPLFHRLPPLPRKKSEIGRHAEVITVRLYRFDTRKGNGRGFWESGTALRESGGCICGLCRGASHRIAMSLSLVDRSTPRLPRLQSCFKTSVWARVPLRHAVGFRTVLRGSLCSG